MVKSLNIISSNFFLNNNVQKIAQDLQRCLPPYDYKSLEIFLPGKDVLCVELPL